MKIFHYNEQDGQLIGETNAIESPLEPSVYLIPAHATALHPLAEQDGFTVNFNGIEWEYRAIPEPVPEPVPEPLPKPEPEPVIVPVENPALTA